MQPDFSVLIPARNERARIAPTIRAIARARITQARLEFIIVDDASTDGCIENLVTGVPRLLDEPRIDIRVCQLDEHAGNYGARNQAAALASADILFCTDAHVQFSKGWDERVLQHIRPDRILAGTVTQHGSVFRGYGARLLVPLMGTSWNVEPAPGNGQVPISVCSATVIPRALFAKLGGYDTGMLYYGAGEPEFSVRAWLHGAEICSIADLEVQHEFKERNEFKTFLGSIRALWVHNCLRFGLLYLSELSSLQMLRYYARAFPDVFQSALEMVDQSDLWQRRATLETLRERSFEWFVSYFGLRDQLGRAIL